mgnify:CR=1 FL=1|tara:strand:- start:3303 stop:3983 length:681 start_codon:yes stop_codon:yes gene_type:complete
MPASRKSKTKVKSKLPDSGISRLDKLPIEIKNQIYDNNYSEMYPFFLQHIQYRLDIPCVRNNIVYDYDKIIKKLKIKNSDIKNFNNIKDKRNFKDFNKKIDYFIHTYVTPTIIEYEEIMEIIEPLSVYNERNHDFEYYLNKINLVESRLKTHINKFNKLLHILKSKFNCNFNLIQVIFINNAIYHLNKVTKKLLPTITSKKNSIRYTRSLNDLKKSRYYTRRLRTI